MESFLIYETFFSDIYGESVRIHTARRPHLEHLLEICDSLFPDSPLKRAAFARAVLTAQHFNEKTYGVYHGGRFRIKRLRLFENGEFLFPKA